MRKLTFECGGGLSEWSDKVLLTRLDGEKESVFASHLPLMTHDNIASVCTS